MMMLLELVPARLSNSGQLYDAVLGGRKLCSSRKPFYEAARVLRSEGVAPETVLEARHAGSLTVAMRSTVGGAARWSITESERYGPKRIEWRPFGGLADAA